MTRKKNNYEEKNLPVPSIDDIKKALEKSGYLFEQRICPTIGRFFDVIIPNEQYRDQDTGESREIDILAESINSLYRADFEDIFWVRLLFECKNNSTPVVFFTQKEPLTDLAASWVLINGYPDGVSIDKDGGVISIGDYFNIAEFCHYCNAEWIARQFCQMKPKIVKKGSSSEIIEWEAKHEGLYESVKSLTKAAEYFSLDFKESIVLTEETKNFIHLGIVYPILIFSGQIYECRIEKEKYSIIETEHVTFSKSFQSRTIEGTYYIDVIRETYLENFLELVSEEYKKIIKKLKRKRKMLKENVIRNYEKEKAESKIEKKK